MVSFKFLSNPIEFADGEFPVLVIENKRLFRNVICSFENDNEEEYFVFSKDYTPIKFSKYGLFISNVLNVDLESKKLLGKINSYMEETANDEFILELSSIKQNLLTLAEKLCSFCDFDCEYNCDISTSDIIKTLQFKIGKAENTPEELLIMYFKLISKYLKINLFVVKNLHLMFDENELAMIYQELGLNHINVISLECFEPESNFDFESFHIIDKDLCEIDKGEI